MGSSPSSARRRGAEVPRLFTPPLRRLTRKTSLGFAVIDFAELLGIELFPWQRWLLVHALELRPDGGLRFRKVVVLVARQNGKSTLSQVLTLWWIYVHGCRTVLGTAQSLDIAEEVWEGAVDLAQDNDELRAEIDKVIRVNGKKALVLDSGNRYAVKAANRRAGRGLSGDRVILDELREHQSWDAWGAITKTTIARPDAQIWCLSNAGDMTSVVLRYLRKIAHQALGDPDGFAAADDARYLLPGDDDDDAPDETAVDDLGLFEWSAPPGCAIRDRDAWAMANPSLGYTILESTLASDSNTDPEWVFRTECLCQWSEGGLAGPFEGDSWEQCAADPRRSKINTDSRVVWGLDVQWERRAAHIVVAGHAGRSPQVEVAASRAGTGWVVDWFTEKPERMARPVAIQKGSPAWSLAPDLEEAGVKVVEWSGDQLGVAHGVFFDEVRDGLIRHNDDPRLNLAAGTAAVKILGSGAWVVDRKNSPQDSAPLIAAIGARWLLGQAPAVVAPLVRPRIIPARKAAPDSIARMGF